MSLETGETVTGRIVKVTERGLVVSLSDENIGIVPTCASLSIETMMERFSSDDQVCVLVGVQSEDGNYALSIQQKPMDADAAEFDQEFARLNHELTNYSSRTTPTDSTVESPSIEEKMEEWIAKAEKGLAHLHKSRGKRLSEEFYNNKQ